MGHPVGSVRSPLSPEAPATRRALAPVSAARSTVSPTWSPWPWVTRIRPALADEGDELGQVLASIVDDATR